MAHLPKRGLARGHDKLIHGSCAIYFPGGISREISCQDLPSLKLTYPLKIDPWNLGDSYSKPSFLGALAVSLGSGPLDQLPPFPPELARTASLCFSQAKRLDGEGRW